MADSEVASSPMQVDESLEKSREGGGGEVIVVVVNHFVCSLSSINSSIASPLPILLSSQSVILLDRPMNFN